MIRMDLTQAVPSVNKALNMDKLGLPPKILLEASSAKRDILAAEGKGVTQRKRV